MKSIPMQTKIIRLLAFFALSLVHSNFIIAQAVSPADNIDATHYEIRIHSIDFQAHSITASTTVTLTPLSDELSEISLDLINLDVTGVWLNGIQVTDFTQSDSLLTFLPSSPLQTGDTASVKIDYQGIPFHESWGGFHFSGEYAFNLGVGISTIPHNLGKSWYPCVDNFTDRATYDVYCTLPEGKMAVGGGVLAEVIGNGNGTSTYHWHLAQTIPTYLSSLAVGSYGVVSDTFSGINGQIPIDIYVRPADTGKVAGTFSHLKEILGIFEECMGPYPWDRVGYTGTAIGAMEHVTNIFVPHNTITGNLSNESLMAHELTHMWMGDNVTCSSAEEMWINEGWATFFQMYYRIPLYGDEQGFKQEMRLTHSGVMQYVHTPFGDGSYFPMNQIPQEYTYSHWSSYDRGSTIVQALRFYLGDSLFFEAVKDFTDEFAYSAASSYDMRDCMSDFTGIDMSGFFDNYVLMAGTPHYSLDSFVVGMNSEGMYDVTVHVKQKRKGPAFTGNGNIVEVMFMDENWNRYSDTIHFDGATGSTTKMVPFIPSVVMIDPEEKMCDATTDHYKTIKATGEYSYEKTFFTLDVESIVDSAFVRVTHNWAPPDSLWEPVAGMRLSPYRYWTIEGIFPEGFSATGTFFYSINGYLDDSLILSSSDTAVILYRKNAGEDWREIEFDKVGPWHIGNIMVHDLQPGEYTLAVKEAGVGSYEPDLPKKKIIEVYPNPSTDGFSFTLDIPTNGELFIFNEMGARVNSFLINEGQSQITWKPGGLPAGTYLVMLYDKEGHNLEAKKIVYVP
jgi:aminopeptidase N